MTNIYEFMNRAPYLTFFLALLLYSAVKWPFICIKRAIRSRDIQRHGWPPPHCDADGDFAEEGK